MNSVDLSDQELWLQVTADSNSAFVILYNRHWKTLLKTAHFYLKDTSLAEEVVHDVYVVLWNRRKYLKIESFQNYIYITARYHVFKKLKEAKRSQIDYVEEYRELSANITFSGTTEKLLEEDFETELKTHLNGLPKRCVEIFLLSRINQLSNTEIAERLGISRFTVENQITHALKHLRTQISSKAINN